MTKPEYAGYFQFLKDNVMEPFYVQRLEKLKGLRLRDVLSRKNPYLFKAKNIQTPGEFAESIVSAYLSSQEETMFGNLLEGFAIHISHEKYGGFKSTKKSLDLEFERDGKYYIVGIKSGTSWGNSDQITAMKNNFKRARKELRDSGVTIEIVAVNGCIYGKDRVPLKTCTTDMDLTYYKYAGQEFWKFISEDDELYREIIVPIDQEAKVKDEAFKKAYTAKVNELTLEFSLNFLDSENLIDWEKLVRYVSGREAIPLIAAPQTEKASDKATDPENVKD